MLSFLGRTGMRRWKFCSILILALGSGVFGCGSGGASSTISLTISPTTASVITNTTQTFTPFVTGTTDTAVTWTVTCPTGVTAPACGTIDTNGVYTAPKVIPTVTSNGTTVITPTATITGAAHADSTKKASATVTIISGISISINPTTATVGTLETFNFDATVSNRKHNWHDHRQRYRQWHRFRDLQGVNGSAHPECGHDHGYLRKRHVRDCDGVGHYSNR